MTGEKRNFDREAAAWDENPARVRLAHEIARAVAERVPLAPDMDVLDFGCGTGLVALALAPLVRSVTGADSSAGMLDVLEAKVARMGVTNVRGVHCDLEAGGRLPGAYHLVVCNMTLHHIRDTAALLAQLHEALVPRGHLCVADLDPDGGLFHPDPAGVFHNGFERAALRREFEAAGLGGVRDATAAELTRPGADGQPRRFTIFLMSGRKAGAGV